MRVTLSPDERAIVESTLALANRKSIPVGLFGLKRFIEPRLKPHVNVKIESLFALGPEDFADAGGKVTVDLIERVTRDHHAQLRRWLGEIARRGLAAYPMVAPEIARNLPEGNALRPTLEDGRVVYHLTVNVIPGLLAYGTALILDRDRGLAKRLGQCGHCGRFNLTFEGRPRTYCSKDHRFAYDRKMAAARMKSWRERNRRKRERDKR